ncbi:MAG: hypothetical protein V3V08_06995 [Nannocystaceae bacterium]
MLPITSFFYVAMVLWVLGLVVGLRGLSDGRALAGVAMSFAGLGLLAVAFSRYWGNPDGLALAAVLGLVSLAWVALARTAQQALPPDRRIARNVAGRAVKGALWSLGVVGVALATVFANPLVSSPGPNRVHNFGGLRLRLQPTQFRSRVAGVGARDSGQFTSISSELESWR